MEHRVWEVGTGSKVITIKENVCEIFDIDFDDLIIIDWKQAIDLGIIEIVRNGKNGSR